MSADEEIELANIIADDAAQCRVAGLNPEIVAEYAEAMDDGVLFPSVIVYANGEGMFLADGFHRVAAARKLGVARIKAEVREGTLRDATLHAAGANTSHGLRRSSADKRSAITILLRDPVWTKWSDRKIGEACGADHKTVAAVRRELSGEFPQKSAKVPSQANGAASAVVIPSGSMVRRLLSTLSDEAVIAECRRRGIEVVSP